MQNWNKFHKYFVILIPILLGAQTTPVIKGKPYLSSVTQSSIIITWQTDILSNSQLEYGLTESYGSIVSDSSQVQIHSFQVTSLMLSTTYHYRVTSGTTSSEDNFFQTAISADEDFVFVAYGDTRTNPDDHLSVVNSIIATSPNLILNIGDIVEYGGSQYQWDIYFDTIRDLGKNTPIYPITGNHEEEHPLYYNQHFLPHNNPDSTEEYYSFDYGNSHFIGLNTNIPYEGGSPQYIWLENDLQTVSSATWIFVFFHHPPYSSDTHHGSDLSVRNAFSPLFECYGVDMVFYGHVHAYERTFPINGATYILTGGGGAPLVPIGSSWWTAYSESTLEHVKLAVSEEAVRLWMIKPDGTVGDSTTVYGPLGTRTEAISEEHSYNSITITAPYVGDQDVDGNAILEYKLSSEDNWVNAGNMERIDYTYRHMITGLPPETSYDVRVQYIDPDGVWGMDNPQTITGIHTLPIVSTAGTVYAGYSPQGVVVSAFYSGDANADGTAMLEHKLSSGTIWNDDGLMTKESETSYYYFLIPDIIIGDLYDIRVTYFDPDGIVGNSEQTLVGVQTTISSLSPHSSPIIVDGNLDDWQASSFPSTDTGILDYNENEYIWKDAVNDDLGDGGDAPNVSDNPEPYSYPNGGLFSGSEADIEEFRVAYDEDNLYFLVDLADSVKWSIVPYSIILIDQNGAVSGSHNVESRTEVNLDANHAWDFKITANNHIITLTDALGNDVSTGALLAQNLDQNFFEISIPISTIGPPAGNTWSFALLQTLGSLNRVIETQYSVSSTRGGGGIDGLSDPDVYDLIGASGDAQYADLNNYTETDYTVLSNSFVDVTFSNTEASLVSTPLVLHIPKEFKLFQNYPNPFNPITTIQYELPQRSDVQITIYDLLGRKVTTLLSETQNAGYKSVQWNAASVPSGMYFYQIKAGDYVQTRKMILLK